MNIYNYHPDNRYSFGCLEDDEEEEVDNSDEYDDQDISDEQYD